MLRGMMIGLAAAAAVALPAAAQDHYVIGLTGAMTGPAAGSLAPAVEGVRLYVERLNAAGGVNGKKIELILQDDAAEPSKAAANVKKLLSQDNVILLINASLSSTCICCRERSLRPVTSRTLASGSASIASWSRSRSER